MKLYGYWRSSSAWRVRIALAHKGIPYTYIPVNLLHGEQLGEVHHRRNPMDQVPVLELEDGTRLTQSLAMIDYLEHLQPQPALLPEDPVDRARVLALAEIVNAGIQPVQNLAILKRVTALGGDRAAWGREVVQSGLEAFQQLAGPHAGTFCFGDHVTLADVLLVPQLYNARRFGCDLAPLSLLTTIEARCAALPAFQKAHPDAQSDANPS